MLSNSSNARAALVQLVSGDNVTTNLQQACHQLVCAKEQGAQLVQLPENFAVFGSRQLLATGRAELDQQGPLRQWMSRQAIAILK